MFSFRVQVEGLAFGQTNILCNLTVNLQWNSLVTISAFTAIHL